MRRNHWLLLVLPLLALSACAPPNRGSDNQLRAYGTTSPPSTHSSAATNSGIPATWELLNPDTVTAQSTVLDVAVTRFGCANGVTGEVLEPPRITYEAEQIVIQVDVAPLVLNEGDEGFNCPGNDAVPITIELIEPIGERHLIDQACLSGPATRTAYCMTATRWP